MDKEELLSCINTNLNTVILNQAHLYIELKKIADSIELLNKNFETFFLNRQKDESNEGPKDIT